MKLAKVEKNSFWYAVVRAYVKFAHDNFFYKKVIYTGKENIPQDKPVIIAPNHQNSLMDALAVLFAQKSQLVFLARSDIFKNPTIAKILFFFKILPVYRIRDGKEKLKLNEIIFEKTIEILEKRKKLVIFPEATHINKKHLQRLKKGAHRIAFMTEEKNNFQAEVMIVPVGMYYSNYWNFKSILQVNFGKPISMSEYFEDYKKNKARTIVKSGNDLFGKIRELMIDIRDVKYHETYELLRDIYDTEMMKKSGVKKFTQINKFKADKKTISLVEKYAKENPEGFIQLHEITKEYGENLKKIGIKDKIIEKPKSLAILFLKSIFLIIFSPVFIYGTLNNILPYLFPKLITRKLEDRQFESSVVFGLGLITFPLYYLILFISAWLFFECFSIGILYLISLPFSGLFAFRISRKFIKLKSQFRFWKNKNNPKMKNTIKLRRKIMEILNGLST